MGYAVVALGPRGLAARRFGPGPGHPFAVSRIEPELALEWLREALSGAADALGLATGDTIDVLVLRPLALGKVVELPPVRRDTLRALATSNLERLFPVRRDEWVADAWPLERGRRGPRRTLVNALRADVLHAMAEAASETGLRLGRVVPGPAAAAFHARRLGREGACPASGRLELSLPGYTEVVRLGRAIPLGLVPLPAGMEPGLRMRIESMPAAAEGPAPACSTVARDWPLALDLAETASRARRIPQPLTPSLLELRHGAARRRSRSLAGAACVAAALGFGLQIAGQQRELASVREARAMIAPEVARAIEQRSTVSALEAGVGLLAAAERSAPGWPDLFRDLAAALPAASYVSRVSGRPDSLVLTTEGDQTAARAALHSSESFEPLAVRAGETGAESLVVAWRPNASGGADAD